MTKLLVIDSPWSALAKREEELRAKGYKPVFCSREPLIENARKAAAGTNDYAGILLHYTRHELVETINQIPELSRLPVLIWLPSNAGIKHLERTSALGSCDFVVGIPEKQELKARFAAARYRLHDMTPRLKNALGSLSRINRAITSLEDDFTVLATAASELERVFKGIRCSIMMVSPEKKAALVLIQGDKPEPLNILLDIEKYPEIQKMLATRKPVAIKNVKRHPLMKEVREFIKQKDLYSVLAVPILFRKEVVGLIMLRSLGAPREFSKAEITFCEMVAQTAAAVLHNIRTNRELLERLRESRQAKKNAKKAASDLQRMETLFDHASDGIVVVNKKARIKGTNVNFSRLSGYSREELQGKDVTELIIPPPGSRDSIPKILRTGTKARLPERTQQILLCKDGSRKWVDVRVEYLPKVGEWLLSLHDMTEKRELDEALKRTKDFLENVIQSSMDAIIAADMSGTIILFNRAAEKISGYRAEEVVGKMNIVDFYAPGVARDIMKRLRSDLYGGKGKLETTYNELIGKDGKPIPINMSAAVIYEDGREVATVGVFQDQRERIRIEKELRQIQEKLSESRQKAALAAFSGAAAHELNQPLTSILGYSELLKRVEKTLADEFPEHPAVASLKNAADIINQEAERMAQVVRKLGEVTEFEIKDYVGGAKIMDLERARAKAADENAEVWTSIFNNMEEAVIVFGEDTVIQLANPAAFALAEENPVGKSFTRYLEGIEHAKAMEAMNQLRSGKVKTTEVELEISSAGGRKARIFVKGSKLPDRPEYLAIIKDITKLTQAEAALREMTAFHDQLLNNSTLPLITLDIDGKVTFWNRAAEKLLGFSAEEAKGQPGFIFIENETPERFNARLRAIRKAGDAAGDVTLRTRNGEAIRVYHVDAVMRDEQGEAVGFLFMLFDLSDQKRLEQEIKEKTEQISILTSLTEAVRSKVGMEQSLGEILKKLAAVLPSDIVAITVKETDSPALLSISYQVEKDKISKSLLRLYEDEKKVKDIIFGSEPLIVTDYKSYLPEIHSRDIRKEMERLEKNGLCSVLLYPLKFQDQVLGSLHLLSRRPAAYQESDLEKIDRIAGPVILALANARLFNQIERQHLELARRTRWMENLIREGQSLGLDATPEEVVEKLTGTYLQAKPDLHFTAWLKSPDSEEFKLVTKSNLPRIKPGHTMKLDPSMEQLIRERPEIIEVDLRHDKPLPYQPLLKNAARAFLAPVNAPDRLLGLLILESHHLRSLEEEEKLELNLLASHLAGALRNIYYHRDLDFARRFQESLIQNANALIIILDREAKVVLINRALEELLGRPAEQVVGKSFRELFKENLHLETDEEGLMTTEDKNFRRFLRRVDRGENLENLRVTIFSPDGRESRAIFNTTTILDREGKFLGFIAIGQNMTRFQEMEKHLLQAEKLATVGQMAAGVAHELNNPVTSIINTTLLLERLPGLDEKAVNLTRTLKEETRRIQNLIQNLMSYSRPSREQMFPVDIRQIVLESLSFSHYELSRGHVKVETRIPEGLPPVRGIKDQLQQVFINLLTNASHACAEKGGGKITIDAAPLNHNTIEVKIKDDGVGIPPENLDKLFDPFFTTKPEGRGTGLGLTIVKEILARHQGKIKVESKPGQGSVFSFTLPLWEVNH